MNMSSIIHPTPSVHSAGAPPMPQKQQEPQRWALTLARNRESTLLVVLVLLIVGTSLANPAFLSWHNARDVLLNVAITAILTAGMTVVMLMRHIDLSISSTLGITAYAVGSLFIAIPGLPIPLAVFAGVLIGLFAGCINGALVTLGRVPSLVATLSTLYIFRGIDYAWVHGGQINATSLPDAFSHIANGNFFGLPLLVIIAAVVLIAVGYYLKFYRGGREFYAIGSNPEAATLAGIRVNKRVFNGFALSGALAGLAGVLWLARFGTVDASTGKGVELQVVAAAVVGSVAITGGVGNVWGATLGALLLGVINISLVVLRVSSFWQLAIQGGLIVLAIVGDTLLSRQIAKWSVRKREHA